MEDIAVKIDHVSKEYRLGTIGGGTLRGDLQSWWARIRGQEDPNSVIGSDANTRIGERFKALDDVSFQVRKGEAVGIIGHNGAGKSTLLKLLSRVTAPTEGTIAYNGRIASMLEVGTGFHPELTGRENVYMNGAILGMTKAEIDRKFEQIVEFAEMEKFIDTPVKRYSSGMYVKLAFSVAAHLDSEIMVMDEVLAVGDMKFQQKCLGRMDNAASKEGRTVLYVSHNMNTIRQLCTRCIVLNHGRLLFDGEVEKAIDIYMESAKANLRRKIDLSAIERKGMPRNSSFKMIGFTFCTEDGPYIKMKEALEFSIKVYAEYDSNKVCLRSMFYFEDNPIGMASTVAGDMILRKGLNEIGGTIDTSQLAPGNYRLKLALYQVNDYGTEEHCDVVDNVIFFHVADGSAVNNMTWQHRWWGSVRMNNIELRK